MPSAKTECSELSVAFGILGIEDPFSINYEQIETYFEKTLSSEKYVRFVESFSRYEKLCWRMYEVGTKLRANYPLFVNVKSLQWAGPQRQAATTSSAKDLLVANVPVSIKAKSNVVLNPSPYNIFESIPSGMLPIRSSENWYLEMAPTGLQTLYDFIRSVSLNLGHLPEKIIDFEDVSEKDDRRAVQKEIKELPEEQRKEFDILYWDMCHEVAQASAVRFNENFSNSMKGKIRTVLLEHVAGKFFRLNSVDYILGGIDRNDEFAVIIPDLTRWKRDWQITNIEAVPDLKRRQSVVDLLVSYRNKKESAISVAKFHIEIRWSHGKFCGSPEAKLYKDFAWNDIYFLDTIV